MGWNNHLQNIYDVVIYGVAVPAIWYFMTHMKFKPHGKGPYNGEPTNSWFFGANPGIQGPWEYRPLGTELTVSLYRAFESLNVGPYSYHGGSAFTNTNENLYLATIAVALTFFILFGVLYYVQLDHMLPGQDEHLYTYLIVVSVLALTTHQLTPVDTPSFFFLIATISLLHAGHKRTLFLLVPTVILGTLAKGGTLALAFAYALAHLLVIPHSGEYHRLLRRFVVGSAAFLVTFFGIRIPHAVLGPPYEWNFGTGIRYDNLVVQYPLNGDHISIIIAAAMLLVVHRTIPVTLTEKQTPDQPDSSRRRITERTAIGVLYVVSLPFLVGVLVGGNWREIRIFAPLFIVHSLFLIQIRQQTDLSLSITKPVRESVNMLWP